MGAHRVAPPWLRAATIAVAEQPTVLERDDAFQVASLEAWRASLRFDETRGVNETTWCVGRAKRALVDQNRRHARRRNIAVVVTMEPSRLAVTAVL